MKCPILLVAWYLIPSKDRREPFKCLKGECEWWHTFEDEGGTTHGACVLIHIADIQKGKKQ